MDRIIIQPRPDWQAKCEQLGFDWHTPGRTYWDESAYWRFSQTDIDRIQSAATDGYAMLMDAIDYVITTRQLPMFGYGPETITLIEASWANRANETPITGRFDMAYDGVQPKIMSFTSDTPAGLFETAMAQRGWLQDVFPAGRQVNSIHEALLARFRQIAIIERTRPRLDNAAPLSPLYVTCLTPDPAAETNAVYLQNLANEGGVLTKFIALSDIGWQDPTYDDETGYYVDMEGNEIEKLMLLAPLNFMLGDDFGAALLALARDGDIQLIEPAWKLLASNKRILATMWERNAYMPCLLNTAVTLTPEIAARGYVSKPFTGADGQNITIKDATGAVLDQTGGGFEEDQFVYQERAEQATVPGLLFASIGAWVIDSGAVVALSVREAETPITDADARIVPHIVE